MRKTLYLDPSPPKQCKALSCLQATQYKLLKITL